MATWSQTWTFFEGNWHEGNVPIMGARSHGAWLASTVFDGARIFEGTAPDLDLHCARVNRSAKTLGLNPTMELGRIIELTQAGMRKFTPGQALYVKPMYWGEGEGASTIIPDPDDTGFALCIFEAPMPVPGGLSVTSTRFRRPTLESMPTDAKAGATPTTPVRCGRRRRRVSTTRSSAMRWATWRKPRPPTSSWPRMVS
jgi:branched-chain amino acid aminotransferase